MGGARTRRAARAGLSSLPCNSLLLGGKGGGMSTTRGLDIQRLGLDDVTAIEKIEQRSMPAPWSRMMFVSEIVKSTSICLGAFVEEALIGYVIVSRYVDAWHAPRLLHGQPRGRADHVARSPLPGPVILGIETSCDETAAALITLDGEIRANVVASQAALHARFGG